MGLFSLFEKKDKKGIPYKYLPIPTHMRSILVPIGDKNSGFEVTGKIKCPCGHECFEVWESNDRRIVTTVCTKCKEKIVLFDEGKHGWDAVMCGQDGLREKRFPYNGIHILSGHSGFCRKPVGRECIYTG